MTEKPSTLDQLESRYTEMIGFTPPKIAKRLKLGMQVDPELVTALEDWRIAALTPKALDVQELARRLVAHAPERCLWGSNWPHPGRTPRRITRRCWRSGRLIRPRYGRYWSIIRRFCMASDRLVAMATARRLVSQGAAIVCSARGIAVQTDHDRGS